MDTIAAEVAAHHEALARWLSGTGDSATSDALDAFRAAHTDDFSLVTVDGEVVPGAKLFADLATARGARPGLRITVHDVVVVSASAGSMLVRFTERHHVDGGVDERVVSALLREDRTAARGLRWQHVHETAR